MKYPLAALALGLSMYGVHAQTEDATAPAAAAAPEVQVSS